jgi:hypothetical protein
MPRYIFTDYFYFDGDSAVAEHVYKKVFSHDAKLRESIKHEGLMREQEQKTYFIPASRERELLLYDFSLYDGMNFAYQHWNLYCNVDSIDINCSMKKRIQIKQHPNSYWIVDTWIEGMGSLQGILCTGLSASGGYSKLLCYFQNNELIYKNPDYSECYYDLENPPVSIKTIDTNDYFVYPNPVDDILTVSFLNNEISQIEIFNIDGKKIYNQMHGNNIDVSSFIKGIYILNLHNRKGEKSVIKFIKK